MSGQYWAGRGWVLPFEKVREFAPAAMAKFEAACEAYEEEYENDPLHDLEYDDLAIDDPLADALEAAYKDVQAVVLDATGLEISTISHDSDGEYENDDLWPCFYCSNVEIITVPGRMAIDAKLIENTGWVFYG